jgi:hypothetical protein
VGTGMRRACAQTSECASKTPVQCAVAAVRAGELPRKRHLTSTMPSHPCFKVKGCFCAVARGARRHTAEAVVLSSEGLDALRQRRLCRCGLAGAVAGLVAASCCGVSEKLGENLDRRR